MKLQRIRLLPLLLLTSTAAWSEAHQPLLVGVLDDQQSGEQSARGKTSAPQVRVVFALNGKEWIPAAADAISAGHSSAMNWSVAQEGRKLAVITSTTSAAIPNELGVIGNPAAIPAHQRPLLVTSGASVADPEGWRPAELTATELMHAHAAFRKVMPLMQQCDEAETPPTRYVPYGDEDISVVSAWRASDGRVLVGQELNPDKLPCGWYDDQSRSRFWQVLDAGGHAQLLGIGLGPVAAADLDADGHSEWLFTMWISGGCGFLEGYALYSQGFARRTDVVWSH